MTLYWDIKEEDLIQVLGALPDPPKRLAHTSLTLSVYSLVRMSLKRGGRRCGEIEVRMGLPRRSLSSLSPEAESASSV